MKQNQKMKRGAVKKRRKAYAILLALPPLMALAMIFLTYFTNKAIIIAPQGIMLSPVKDSSPLILSLIIFIIGYIVFIGILFREVVEKFFFQKILHRKQH